MKHLTLILLCACLSGCGSLKLSNRISETAACDKILITSWWQWFGITTEADEKDAAVLLANCNR